MLGQRSRRGALRRRASRVVHSFCHRGSGLWWPTVSALRACGRPTAGLSRVRLDEKVRDEWVVSGGTAEFRQHIDYNGFLFRPPGDFDQGGFLGGAFRSCRTRADTNVLRAASLQ